ncbi:uncharacterized protein LOC144887347 isoform X1 [Branchiostoma floridae x Branchiostoma japonicum]
MAKYNVNVEKENIPRGKIGLQFVLAGLVFLLACLVVVIVLVYVHMAAAIADLSRRLESVEGSLRSTGDLSIIPGGRSAEGQGYKYVQDSAKNKQSIGRSRRSDLKDNLAGSCESYELQCRNRNCVNTAFVCDQEDDCGDGSDEENCGIDHCEAHLCQNNATCRARVDGYICACTKGWFGKYCQHSMLQKIRRIRHGKNYGMVSLLSVHIPAKTDTRSTKPGEVQMSSGPFTHWQDIAEKRFGLKNGQLEIKETGKYFIYGQLDFDKEEHHFQAIYSINKFQEPQLTCVSTMFGSPPRHTCYTAGVLDLEAGDRLVLSVQCTRCWIYTDNDTTFWGAIKLSADVEIN